MKTIETKLYSFNELSDEAQKRVIEKEAQNVCLDGTVEELRDSMISITQACGLQVADYSYGTYCPGYKFCVRGEQEDLSGPRALAWFLRVLLNNGYSRPASFKSMTFPGICGFTGVCFDDDMAEVIWKELLEGESVYRAFYAMARRACSILEDEEAYLSTWEAITERLDMDEEIYTEDGDIF